MRWTLAIAMLALCACQSTHLVSYRFDGKPVDPADQARAEALCSGKAKVAAGSTEEGGSAGGYNPNTGAAFNARGSGGDRSMVLAGALESCMAEHGYGIRIERRN